jgi:hypothetical protein
MHLGGMVAGLLVGVTAFAQKRRNRTTGDKEHTQSQHVAVIFSIVVLIGLSAALGLAMAFPDLQEWFRTCPFCQHVNCIPTPWWSCCATALHELTCPAIFPPQNASAPIYASCNITRGDPYTASCNPLDDSGCVWDTSNLASLCALICVGCTG